VTIVRHQVTRMLDVEDGTWTAEVIVSAIRSLLRVATDDAKPIWPTLRVRVIEDELNEGLHLPIVRASVDVTVEP
jgi:hypothetical protein